MRAENLLIADASPLCRAGIISMLRGIDPDICCVETDDLPSTNARLAGGDVDLAVLDLGLPGMNNLAGLRALRAHYPRTPLVVTAWSNDGHHALAALMAGAHGYIPKRLTHEDMLRAFETALRGQIYVPPGMSQARGATPRPTLDGASLTGRQREVVDLLSTGKSNKEIARALNIAEGTVKVHVAAVFRLFGVHNRVSAAAALREDHRAASEPLLPGFALKDHHHDFPRDAHCA